MLFDLRGKRRRVVQTVYAVLAALFLISFVGFGVGSDAAGGIFDALGVGGGHGGSSTSPQYEEDIDAAEERLQQDPKDQRALLQLAETRYLAGQAELEADEETGQPVLTDEASEQFTAGIDAWDRYLETKPKNPSPGVAVQLLQAYQLLAQSDTDPAALESHLEGGKETAEITAEQQPGANSFFVLAQFAYLSGDSDLGDDAAAKAMRESSGSQGKQLKKAFADLEKQGEQLQKQIKQQGAGKEQLENPLGGVGGGAAAPTP